MTKVVISISQRRPGIEKIIARLMEENPKWKPIKARTEAKVLWSKGVRN